MTAQAKKRSGRGQEWYMAGSVLNALWGNIMPRLAASVWRGDLDWPPKTGAVPLKDGLEAHPLTDQALTMFAEELVEIGFGTEENYVKAAKGRNRLTKAQLSTLVTTEYFHPGAAAKYLENRPAAEHRLTLRVILAESYDFVLSDGGLDVFVPPTPGSEDPGPVPPERADAAREEVLQFYKFRETSKPPIGLPGPPTSSLPVGDDSFINIPQLTAPTGSHQVPEGWIRAMADEVDWWVSGSLYRGLMGAYPRIIASMWYEDVAWGDVKSKYTEKERNRTYRARFQRGKGNGGDDLKEMLEERVETVLPDGLGIFVPQIKERPDWLQGTDAPGWNENDIMIASDGIYFPDPGAAPTWDELLEAIKSGVAGNPVFTDSGPCA